MCDGGEYFCFCSPAQVACLCLGRSYSITRYVQVGGVHLMVQRMGNFVGPSIGYKCDTHKALVVRLVSCEYSLRWTKKSRVKSLVGTRLGSQNFLQFEFKPCSTCISLLTKINGYRVIYSSVMFWPTSNSQLSCMVLFTVL